MKHPTKSALKKKKISLTKLRKDADKLWQIKLIALNPYSIISGKPTEVMHHWVPKSRSNNLRYDYRNGVPLTHGEHCAHHVSGDPAIAAKILEVNGQKWHEELQERRHIICKLNREYLENIIKVLEVL